jgi:hypothetical protein
VERGKYSQQLKRWLEVFPREQFLILTSDELNAEFQQTMQRAFAFLGLPAQEIEKPKRSNVGQYDKMAPETRQQLIEMFRPYNLELEELLGRSLGWDR